MHNCKLREQVASKSYSLTVMSINNESSTLHLCKVYRAFVFFFSLDSLSFSLPLSSPSLPLSQTPILSQSPSLTIPFLTLHPSIFSNPLVSLLPPSSPSFPPPGNSILHTAAGSVTSAVQKASQALNERGERLGRAEEKTGEMKNSAEQFSVTAHKRSEEHTSELQSR